MKRIGLLIISSLGLLLVLPYSASAATAKLEVSGWLPYWRAASSTADALPHLGELKEVNPFGLSVRSDGTLADIVLNIDEEPWKSFILAAKAKKVRVIPTVMWSDGDAMHQILSDGPKRRALEDQIANLVKSKEYDGIDIDFEGKKAETKDYFSTFLKGLYSRMGKKWVMCTIESRTPLSSRYDTIPKDIKYANDFVQINKYCDRVRIMTYDQGAIDIRLNEAALGLYVPVSDVKWVEKVIKLTAKSIPLRKLVIGIPTYGYEYEVRPLNIGFQYERLWSFNPQYALDLAKNLNISPQRNSAGEISFVYIPQPTAGSIPNPGTFRIAWWSDAEAIRQKVALAKKLGVRGVAIFKLDGGEDPGIWEILKF
ncbi:hypothetical protein A3H04_03010 [Candidatus Giovannonibacteria bacterium RIFCSPLOWO2_12_FULL_43_11c]|nr:MAG: hypothetical protein A2739_02970 [Candidatus Giovannonibacteria bacterium RIFCSPHIGHO2_01_FULL_43_100]OGF67132.1 MAG: hypothetical protein A3B97_04335 [Candidatus Giovannonibacteria bacterium RIFCSPHIGHO2_02_FULL_43_32]OGF79329.1 MAG: hypothetical protein A3A15_01675 [Candidatus Giovannonibacteria bacterium RIFCSPLOWO2_01_FULL_43_60]OGF91947.1 MAG: hypothetical protein A3H04_03010 [Candidatus Giovannonibacteria bacterium RIFCSPLOWO2_12_FULL_43_11c]